MIKVYYHDYSEVDPRQSWTGLCAPLSQASYIDIRNCSVPAVLSLFDYARPDVVITVNDYPVMSLEQTLMNPSGHNIPQRFSSCVRASELGVPSILYYPEFARRTISDPNVRYLNIRVLLAQFRMTRTYQVPSLSIFWPTDPQTNLPTRGQAPQQQMADAAAELIQNAGRRHLLLTLPAVSQAIADMEAACLRYQSSYRKNSSVRALLPNGYGADPATGLVIDPPTKGQLWKTNDYVNLLQNRAVATDPSWQQVLQGMLSREFTLVWTGTANQGRTDSEHPWPGYLTLLDMLYTRRPAALHHHDRQQNLVYVLPVDAGIFLNRMNRPAPPTATYIVDQFSDLITLDGGVVAGRPTRGAGVARQLLSW